jgi:hypothetical protein
VSLTDPQWIRFPRWIKLSGIPKKITETLGVESWMIFHQLIELECEQNLTPDWFSFRLDRLIDSTGLPQGVLMNALESLEQEGWIERTETDFTVQKARIGTPMMTPVDEHEIREKLGSSHVILRYNHDLSTLRPVEKVVYLYQMIFGVRFNPRIAEDLEEIANNYEMGLIYDVFSEAHHKKVKSLSWVKSHLNKRLQEQQESVQQDQ